ncbi:MAG: GNAT family N-acetyltransferase [Rubrobacter sp.]
MRCQREIGFRRLRNADVSRIHAWLHRPHVAKWWYEDVGSYEKVFEQYSAYVEGKEPVEPYFILYRGRPVGYIQSYRVSDEEEFARLVGIEDSAGIDLFIGEEDLLYRGLGPGIVRCFLEKVVFTDKSIKACIIDPEPGNGAAIRAYEKAGFRYLRTIEAPEGKAYLMWLSREEFGGAGFTVGPGS